MRIRLVTIEAIIALLLFSSLIKAQQGVYCNFNDVSGIAWSPNGEQLTVMTLHGALIYDRDLNLIRAIEAPKIGYDVLTEVGPVWSPDGVWIILPQLSLPQHATQGTEGWVIANTQTGELRHMLTPYGGFEKGESYFVEEIAWSPDNRLILVLKYNTELGLPIPYSELLILLGVWDVGMSPILQRYDDLYLNNIRWDAEDGISAHAGGLTLFFNQDLTPKDKSPVFHPSWWIGNADGTLEAAQVPNLNPFYVREVGKEARRVDLGVYVDSNGEVIGVGYISEITWLLNNEHLIGIYAKWSNGEDPLSDYLLQGAIVDARNANLISEFVLQADGKIEDYALSVRGDRIAISRDKTWIELWNPTTQSRLAMVNVPDLPISQTC